MIAPSLIGGLAHEVDCVEVELRLSRADNAKLRRENAQMRQDLRAFALDINMRCTRIAELEKENTIKRTIIDRYESQYAKLKKDHLAISRVNQRMDDEAEQHMKDKQSLASQLNVIALQRDRAEARNGRRG